MLITPFATIQTTNTALPQSSLAVTGTWGRISLLAIGICFMFHQQEWPEVKSEKQQECFNQSYEV